MQSRNVNINIKTFDNWALSRKDIKMEEGHKKPVNEIFNIISTKSSILNQKFSFLDLGCGSGRVIDFFQRGTINKKFIGIEYFFNQYTYCKNIFSNKKHIKIINEDFLKQDFLKYDADCYFFNHPISEDSVFIELVEKIVNSSNKRKVLFIFVNCGPNIFEPLKHAECIDKFYIKDKKGYSIFCLNNN